ncbi:MAG: glycyl-radical enzyme activating protein [Anaerovoracaceae bacterium]|nr:glycyl-radical enzyme activating protein [Bacillota bacterium]MDY2670846.1 glycyl-radical enzyme activating protein [Anaerovoracaceae bacterium]
MSLNCYSVRGVVSEIQRFSVHDGPGIRTLVFLKGCPLRCRWCCNPENLSREPQYMMVGGKEKLIGREMSVKEVMKEVCKDLIYYRRSGGGITISGGECLLQYRFTASLLEAAKLEGFTTAIETSSFAGERALETVLPWVDTALCDIKHVDDEKHIMFTGQSNRLILENIGKIGISDADLIIRVPVIPGFNDTEEEISDIAHYAAGIRGVKKLHLLPYHRLGESKYKGLGMEYSLEDTEPLSPERMEILLAAARTSGLPCQVGG